MSLKIDNQKDAMESITQKPKKVLGGAEAAMAASEELAQLCSMFEEFDEEVPKKKVTKKLTGAEAAMAASEELAELCSMLEFD